MTRITATGRVATSRVFSSVGLNGTTQYVLLNNQSAYNLGTFSIEAWVKGAGGQTTRAIFGEGRSTSANPAFRLATGGGGATSKLSAFLRNDANTIILNSVNSTTNVFDGTWHHIVWSDNNGTVTLYIDKVADATNFNYIRGTLTLNRSSWGSLITNGTAGSFLAGSLTVCRIYSIALNQSQVTAAYNNSGVARGSLSHELLFSGTPGVSCTNTGYSVIPWQTVATPTFSAIDVPANSPLVTNGRVGVTGRVNP